MSAMSAFISTEELHRVMVELWQAIKADPDMSTKLLNSRLIAQFHYREPDGLITIDCSDGETVKIASGDSNIKPVVEMFMSSNVAHDFWTGKTSIPVSILTGKIVAKGPVSKALALVPAIKPAFAIYPDIYRNRDAQKTAV
jgi:putative sterol carrier protein